MSTRLRRVAAAVALGATLTGLLAVPATATSGTPDGEPLKVMAVGDSITHGAVGDQTWRWYVDQHLRSQQVAFDFVGPSDTLWSPLGPAPAAPGFDPDHAAIWGDSFVVPLGAGPVELVAAHEPDVVVLALGTNDLHWYQQTSSATLQRATDWIERARQVRPHLDVVVLGVPGQSPEQVAYNGALGAWAEELTVEGARTVHAPWPQDYRASAGPDDEGDTWDSVHPNESGQAKLATALARSLAEVGLGSVDAPPLTAQPEGPATRPVVGAWSFLDGHRTLQWELPPGADSADVWLRRGDSEWERVSTADTDQQHTVSDLDPCVTYHVRVRARRNWTAADGAYGWEESHRWSSPLPDEAPAVTASEAGGTVTTTWTATPGSCAVRVDVQRIHPDGTTAHVVSVLTEDTSYTLAAPPLGTRLGVTVTPVGADGDGTPGRIVLGTPPVVVTDPVEPPGRSPDEDASDDVGARPAKVKGLKATPRRRSLEVRWTGTASARRYEVLVRRPGSSRVVRRLTVGRTRATAKSLRVGTRYRVQVRALGPAGEPGPWSRTIVVRTRR